MVGSLAVFRGCSRLEYRNQNIKLLRAVDGEHTRASYRLLWVSDDVLELLRTEPNAIATALLVDPTGELVFPVRQLMVADHLIDPATGFLHLTFVIGPFVAPRLDFREDLATWGDRAAACPPERFVSVWRPDWPGLDELPPEAAVSRWREAVDFLTSHWDMTSATFLRLGDNPVGQPAGPSVASVENRETVLRLHSYNPHLPQSQLRAKRLRVFQSGGLVAVESGDQAPLDRDGEMEIRLRCLEPGDAQVDVSVHPDPQFATYLPVKIDVSSDPDFASGRPRLLGREWQACLEGLETNLAESPELHLTVLELLGRAFSDDPSVLQHKGRVHYRRDRLAEARHYFDQAMEMREDATTVAWNLFAALKRGDIGDSLGLLTKLNLSHHHLFDELLEVAETLPEPVALAVVRVASDVFGHDKAMRLLDHLSPTIQSEAGTCELAVAMKRIDGQRAMRYLLEVLHDQRSWPSALRTLLSIADEIDSHEQIEDHAVEGLRWRGESEGNFRARWHQHRHFITTPEVRLALTIRNARQLLDAGIEDLGAELSIEAADAAINQGDLLVAQEALTLVFSNRSDSEGGADYYLDAARASQARIEAVLDELAPIRAGSEEYIAGLYQRLRPWTEGKTLVVVGGGSRHPMADEWEQELRVRRLEWLTSTPSNAVNEKRLRDKAGPNLIVVCLWESMSHLSGGLRSELKEKQADLIWARTGRAGLLEAMHRYFPLLDETRVAD